MSPEKMRKYGVENSLVKIEPERGIAQAMGFAFCSDNNDNLAKALLLRDFAVFYHNRLLETVKEEQGKAFVE